MADLAVQLDMGNNDVNEEDIRARLLLADRAENKDAFGTKAARASRAAIARRGSIIMVAAISMECPLCLMYVVWRLKRDNGQGTILYLYNIM